MSDGIISMLLALVVYGGIDLLASYLGYPPGPEYYYVAIAYLAYNRK